MMSVVEQQMTRLQQDTSPGQQYFDGGWLALVATNGLLLPAAQLAQHPSMHHTCLLLAAETAHAAHPENAALQLRRHSSTRTKGS